MHWIDCRGLKKAAVTNAPKENARVMLAALGMDKWFDAIVLGEDCARPKPHPDPYLDGLKVLGGIEKDEALICEDSPSGTHALCIHSCHSSTGFGTVLLDHILALQGQRLALLQAFLWSAC